MPLPLTADIDDALDPILGILKASFRTVLEGHLVRAYIRGDAEMVTWGQTKGGIPIAYEGPPMKQAIAYAQRHCAKLVTRMDEETKSRLAQVISDGIKEKRGIDGLARDLRREFDDMDKVRSRVIARTETCDALEQAFMDRAEAMGVTGKFWVVTDPCPICEENGNEGIVPIDHIFSSGDERPPAHPNCRCALAPAMLEEK